MPDALPRPKTTKHPLNAASILNPPPADGAPIQAILQRHSSGKLLGKPHQDISNSKQILLQEALAPWESRKRIRARRLPGATS